MTTFCRFIQFNSIDHAKAFCVADAVPEREDGAVGMLPDGTLVWEDYIADDEGWGGVYLVADERRLPRELFADETPLPFECAPLRLPMRPRATIDLGVVRRPVKTWKAHRAMQARV